jgi:nucleoid-associated protein YgaU
VNQQNFETLKQKYASVLSTIQEQGVQLGHLHEEDGKLIIAGKAPSDEAKNRVWDTIKKVDAAYKDLNADITVDPNIAGNRSSSLPTSRHLGNEQTYTVEAGDTLSKISQQFYGEANLYMNIFEANRDKLTDPNKIQPGMRLRIPVTGKQVTQ